MRMKQNLIYQYVRKLNEEGFNSFEANSYTGMEILKNIECNKSLGIDITVMNHLSALYFFEHGYRSVYASIESDFSMLKSLSSFIDGKIEALVFGKIKLFTTRVESEYFKDGEHFIDNYGIEAECHCEKSLNIFVSAVPLGFFGNKIKNEKVYFDSLCADLRFFPNPQKTLEMIFKNNFNEKNCTAFNLFRKLA